MISTLNEMLAVTARVHPTPFYQHSFGFVCALYVLALLAASDLFAQTESNREDPVEAYCRSNKKQGYLKECAERSRFRSYTPKVHQYRVKDPMRLTPFRSERQAA